MDNLFNDLLEEASKTEEPWKETWRGMPEFNQLDMEPWKTLQINFDSEQDMLEFAKLVEQKINFRTPSIWFPKAKREAAINKLWVDQNSENENT